MSSLIARIRTLWYIATYQYLLRKASFGKNPIISCKLKIIGPGKVVIGDHCRFEKDPWGDDYVTIFTHQKSARIIIGDYVVIRATRFGSHLEIRVEDHAVIESASVYDSDFHNIDATKRDSDYNKGDRQVIVKKNAYIGVESLCSKGTVIGEHAVLLPASVIGTKIVPDNTTACGLPARIITSL
jgi:acetyltransferase-like isoleucine patch superfamily enzyme